MSETPSDNTNSNELFLGSVYVRTALYVLLVAAGVFLALQAHQFANRKQDPADGTATKKTERPDEQSEGRTVFDVALPAGELGMYRVEALPPVAPPSSARLRFAWGRRSLDPGRVQLVWVYNASLQAGDVIEHYRQTFRQAGYRWVEGETPAAGRQTLVFISEDEKKLATVSVPTRDADETIKRFDVTMSRPEQAGDFVARQASPEAP